MCGLMYMVLVQQGVGYKVMSIHETVEEARAYAKNFRDYLVRSVQVADVVE